MLLALSCLGILAAFLCAANYSDASPVVTLSTNRSVYLTAGESLELVCEINQYVGESSVWFKKDDSNLIWLINSSTCEFHKTIDSDLGTYNMICKHPGRYVLVIHRVSVGDHKTTWKCSIASYKVGLCYGVNNPCVSKVVTFFQRVPVTTVRMTDEYGLPFIGPVTVVSGSRTNFTCDTSPSGSRPGASFHWYKRQDGQISNVTEDQSIYTTSALESVPGEPDGDLLISYNTLSLSFENSYHKISIICAARDSTNTEIYVQSLEVQINIVYPPVVTLSTKSSDIKIKEGSQNFSLVCHVIESNPREYLNGFAWLHNGKVIQDETSSSYMIQTVHRLHAGQYQCHASNSYGVGSSDYVMINVQYVAKITDLSIIESDISNNILNENDTATLSCFVDSNPESNITWSKEGSEGPLKTDYYVLQSHLAFNIVQCLDTSNYTCKASNGLGTPVDRRISLHVNCHPRTDFRSPLVTQVYSKLRGDAALTYTVMSYPDPTFEWIFTGNGSQIKALPYSATQKDEYRTSTLIFTNLDVEDFGFYSVVATNPFPPSATWVFELIIADVPETPLNVAVVEVTHNRVIVKWLAGHSGGPEQTFHVVAKASDITRSVYAADPGYGKIGTAIIADLTPNKRYEIYMTANNTHSTSNMTEAIIVYTPSEGNETEMRLLFVGVVAVIVVLAVVAIVVFHVKRLRYRNGTTRQQGIRSSQSNDDSQDISPVIPNSVRVTEVTGEHECLQLNANENPYLEVYDVEPNYSTKNNSRLPEGDTYESLRIYANNIDQNYCSVKPPQRQALVYVT